MVGLEQREVDVGVDPARAQQALLGADEREVAAPGGGPPGGELGVAERDDVLGQRQPLDDAPRSRAIAAGRSPRADSTLARPAVGSGT